MTARSVKTSSPKAGKPAAALGRAARENATRSQGVVAPRAEPSRHGRRRQSGDRQQR
jgi:hypothetical protein